MRRGPVTHKATLAVWTGRNFLAVLALVLVGLHPGAGALRAAPVKAGEVVVVPVLSDEDQQRYREIFALQEAGEWNAADRQIKQLKNRVLVGHLLAQRYLHPTAYRSKFDELRRWLDDYADHPDAGRIYRLALRRKPAGGRAPKRPVGTYITGLERLGETEEGAIASPLKTSRAVRKLQGRVHYWLRRGYTKRAEGILEEGRKTRGVNDTAYDILQADVAAGYLSKGRVEQAYALVLKSIERSGTAVPDAYWTAGRAAWRLGRFDAAGDHFQVLASIEGISPDLTTAGAYWAARNELIHRRPQNVTYWLDRAARHPQTFYGILARRALGLRHDYRWEAPKLTRDDVGRIEAMTRGVRALALLEVGQRYRAERELRAVAADPELTRPVLALASHFGLPSLSVRLSGLLSDGEGHPGVAYPIPPWTPEKGYAVDRALLYAIMHQESLFNIRAKSPAGARGLMQLLPGTANLMVRGRPFSGIRRDRLFQPELNLEIGQKFVLHLLKNQQIQGNLFLLTASYNAGLSRVTGWQRKMMPKDDDALLFIESLPSKETRIFVKRVFRNLWIYRERLNQAAPSLDAILGGAWPVYVALDGTEKETQVAEHDD
ncbi:MAG: lytic transglycosylase domain-containing protein [Alphaproteobacteria bacterium]|nr:lytic transglycosylase domain-containing protein [Alphaproteobacteria bacterium]